MNVLFVCSGNTCRSPMAAGLLQGLIIGSGQSIATRSAGLWPQRGSGLAENAIHAMQEIGLDISKDYPKAISQELVVWADFIVPLREGFAGEIEDRFPEVAGKLTKLSRDVDDPVGGGMDKYRDCRDLLRTLLDELRPSLTST